MPSLVGSEMCIRDRTRDYDFTPSFGLNMETPFSAYLEIFAANYGSETTTPESFDWRTENSECVHAVRNQGACGSCWAHAISEAMSDRVCIDSNGKFNTVFSPQQLVDCDYLDHGCNGGNLIFPWLYYSTVGAAEESCYGDYVSGETKTHQFCFISKLSCKHTRTNIKSITFARTIDAIKEEIMNHGPVAAGFFVYEDFKKYSKGIYVQDSSSGRMLGGHAIKIVGWGVEQGTNYWIVQNSWGSTWGENGFFRIQMGTSGIEAMVINARPNL